MARIILAGGTGFIGRHLAAQFTNNGYEIITLTRHPKNPNEKHWNGKTVTDWKQELENAQAIINLAGAPIITHWSEASKLNVLESRLNSTKAIGEAINQCKEPPKVWINSSAIGYYGNRGDEELIETSTPGTKGQFVVDTTVAWEHAQWSICTENTSQVRIRTRIVLGRAGGAFQNLHTLA